MIRMEKRCCLLLIFLLCIANVFAQQDSVKVSRFKAYLQSLLHGNVDRTHEKKLDMSFIAAPCYTREGSFGIGGAATALYRLDRSDSIMQPSDLQLTGSATIKGFYGISLNGNNHFKGNKSRLSYSATFQHKILDFWGVSYDDCAKNPVSEYVKQQIKIDVDYVMNVIDRFHIGAGFVLNYSEATRMLDPSYLKGQRNNYFFTGVGISLQYDTRDFILNPKGGIYLLLKEVVYPHSFGSYGKSLFATTFQFNFYQKLWKNAILGYDLYGQFNSSAAPWPLREELGSGACRMRGYYSGRYIDCSQIATQFELRQHIMKRVGCVAWVGAGTVFPSLRKFNFGNVLPNYGVGLRVEIKHNVNMRIDYGFGKQTAGFVFQMAEAF